MQPKREKKLVDCYTWLLYHIMVRVCVTASVLDDEGMQVINSLCEKGMIVVDGPLSIIM